MKKINKARRETFDPSSKRIIESLNLKKPIYEKTAFGGHFDQASKRDYLP